MMKNMEWGAVAALSQSKYGVFNPESATGVNGDKTYKVWNNSNSNFIIGSVGDIADSAAQTATNAYNTITGIKASTTGTIYGIYDMAGGSWDQVMGILKVNNSLNEPSVGKNETLNTGFFGRFPDGTESTNGFRDLPNNMYYDLYLYSTNNRDYDRGKIGDFTSELTPIDSITWNHDSAFYIYSTEPLLLRGGYSLHDVRAGIFNFNCDDGAAGLI